MGIEPTIVAGRRVTDAETLEIMKMVVGGRLNINLCAALLAAGVKPVGLTGASSMAVRAHKRPPRKVVGGGDEPVDFGWVGDVEGVNDDLISRLLEGGYVPVLACLGGSERGEVFNINGDVVANYVASSLEADHLILVTSVPGVLRDIDDPASRIRTMTAAEAQTAIDEGVVVGGMIPKVAESVAGLERGIGAVHIVGGLDAGQLISELDEPGSVGTAFIGGSSS
jgi:acetylglutamate kinase